MVKIKCLACDGKGNDGYHKEEDCPVCNGTGEIEVKEKTEAVKKEEPKKKVKKKLD